jgi:hypothetical protein
LARTDTVFAGSTPAFYDRYLGPLLFALRGRRHPPADGPNIPQDPPRFLARTPHGLHEIGKIRDEVTEAGFASFEAETVQRVSRAASPRDAIRLDAATDAAAAAVAARFGPGPITAGMQAHVIIAGA